jgi:NADP-dependent 3-hydroxy acid dehydrogenase YdfG
MGIKVTLIETGEVATEMQSDEDIASSIMLEADDVADAILYALTRPTRVCINDIQMFAPRIS